VRFLAGQAVYRVVLAHLSCYGDSPGLYIE
jgi:hypothetical protein